MSNTLNGVEIFSTMTAVPSSPGWPIKLDPSELQDIANNFKVLQAKWRPQLKLGHDDKDGMPSFGTVTNLYVQGDKLLADFADIPEVVYSAIEKKLYKQVSVELAYSTEIGWYLTAVSLLGADLPAIQNLQDLQAFLSAQPGIPGNSAHVETYSFSVAPAKLTGEHPNMDKEQELKNAKAELDQIKAAQAKKDAELELELKAAREERDKLLAQQKTAKFAEAKAKAMAPYEEMVKAKTLEPGIRDKIADALSKQEAKFSASEGEELQLPAALVLEINASMKPTKDMASGNGGDNRGESPDVVFAREVHKVMASTGKSYEEASRLACSANPQIAADWLRYTNEIHMKGVY